MAILKSENFDLVVAPALPGGFAFDAVFTTGSPLAPVTPVSNPNVLILTPVGATDNYFGTFTTPDGAGGDVSIQSDFNAATSTGVTLYGVAARGSATPLDYTSVSYYRGTLDVSSGTINIDKVVSGVVTNLVSLPFGPGFLNPQVWYTLYFTLSGTTLSIAAQRLSDSNWVHKVGGIAVWQPGQVIADTVTDGSLTGSGYAGIDCRQSGGGTDLLYVDNFLFSSIGTGTPPVYTQPQTFDDVIAPALPSGFTFDSPLATTATFSHGIVPITPPNTLVLSVSGVPTIFAGTSATIDASGGDVTVMGYVNSPQTTNDQVAGLMARGSNYPIDPIADSYYWLEQDYQALEARISAVVSGGATVLDSIAISELENPGWYLLVLAVNGIDIQAFIQRQSDLAWLDPSGNWVPTYQSALSATDSSITGSGYLGMTLVSRDDVLYLDSWTALGAISKTLAIPFYDRIFESGSVSGIGSVGLLGHFSSYSDFSVVGDGASVSFCIADPINDAWEISQGVYTATVPSLSRNTVLASSNNNQLVSFVPGPKDVFTSISARYIQRTQVTLFDHFVDASNVTNSETDLYSNDIAGNTLQFDGDKISARYAVNLVSSASTKRIRVYLAGTRIHDGLALTTSGAGNILVDVLLIRDSATSVRYAVSSTAYLATPTNVQSLNSLGSLDLTGNLTLTLTGEAAGGAAASGDLTATIGDVLLIPAAS